MQAAKAVSDGPTDDAKQCLQRFAPKIARFIQKWERWQSCFKFGSIKRQTYYSLCASKQDKMTTRCKKCWSIHTCNFKIVDRVVLVFHTNKNINPHKLFTAARKTKTHALVSAVSGTNKGSSLAGEPPQKEIFDVPKLKRNMFGQCQTPNDWLKSHASSNMCWKIDSGDQFSWVGGRQVANEWGIAQAPAKGSRVQPSRDNCLQPKENRSPYSEINIHNMFIIPKFQTVKGLKIVLLEFRDFGTRSFKRLKLAVSIVWNLQVASEFQELQVLLTDSEFWQSTILKTWNHVQTVCYPKIETIPGKVKW